MKLTIGVAALQGAFTEHEDALRRALEAEGLEGEVVEVRSRAALDRVDALVLPGGESTTISKLLSKFGMFDRLRERAETEDLPLLGTCAGMVLLAGRGDEQVSRTRTPLLELMDFQVDRNAFGRQRESSETTVTLELDDGPTEISAVFIRAPAVRETWGDCRPIGRLGEAIVGCAQGNRLALSFHPELTDDITLHRYFLRKVAAWKKGRRVAKAPAGTF